MNIGAISTKRKIKLDRNNFSNINDTNSFATDYTDPVTGCPYFDFGESDGINRLNRGQEDNIPAEPVSNSAFTPEEEAGIQEYYNSEECKAFYSDAFAEAEEAAYQEHCDAEPCSNYDDMSPEDQAVVDEQHFNEDDLIPLKDEAEYIQICLRKGHTFVPGHEFTPEEEAEIQEYYNSEECKAFYSDAFAEEAEAASFCNEGADNSIATIDDNALFRKCRFSKEEIADLNKIFSSSKQPITAEKTLTINVGSVTYGCSTRFMIEDSIGA